VWSGACVRSYAWQYTVPVELVRGAFARSKHKYNDQLERNYNSRHIYEIILLVTMIFGR